MNTNNPHHLMQAWQAWDEFCKNGALLIHVDRQTGSVKPLSRIVEDASDDGFNPYGSGPEPIGRREG
ncbi:hypothetical protein [Thalassospira lohafexi]|uniref:Uncharacterized protein n=1 Tax=Thalassospira lohafexi TaxID=744227 RepID=A0A2N3L0N8_9PROT|nr:hypothetical protein [Thalassospira lohafexi]PKR56361.1 hypothetical protein COO92_21385 [Thalassospira lohafexi]